MAAWASECIVGGADEEDGVRRKLRLAMRSTLTTRSMRSRMGPERRLW